MVVGVPNVGKSALINSIHRIATSRFPGIIISEKNKLLFWIIWDPCSYCCNPVPDKNKRAMVGPLPGVTQDIAGYKVRIWTNISLTFLTLWWMFVFFPYYHTRYQTRPPPSPVYIICIGNCQLIHLGTSFFLSLNVNSMCLRTYLSE